MDLSEAYRLAAVESYTKKHFRVLDQVEVVPGGAWIQCEVFIESWFLGNGFNLTSRAEWEAAAHPEDVEIHRPQPGVYALWDPANPETPILSDSLDELINGKS